MPHKGLPRTKSVKAGGKTYLYFVTARVNEKGRPILVRLPPLNDRSFGSVYASHMAGVTSALEIEEAIIVPALVRMYEHSPKFRGLSDNTQRVYSIYLRRFAEGFVTAPAGEIARKDILRVIDQMTPGAASGLVRTVGALYVWARRRGHVENDPCRDIDPQEAGEHEPWDDEILQLALASDDDGIRLAVHLLLYTAQRIGDVCRMRWTDIAGDVIRVQQEKTGREMQIRIHQKLGAELARHPRSFETILSFRGKPLGSSTLRERLKRFASERGHKIVPHGLRKNAVNALLESGCSVPETAAISGQSMQMVEFYAKKRSQAKLGSAAILKWENSRV